MRRHWLVVAFSGLALSIALFFQNCAPPKLNPDSDLNNFASIVNSAENPITEVLSIDYFKVALIPDTSGAYKNTQGQSQGVLNFNLIEGRAKLTDSTNQSSQVYCLSQNQLNELNQILSKVQVCEQPGIQDNNIVCAQVYKAPYAIININNQEEVALGEKFSSCGRSLDLCGEQSAHLQEVLKNLMPILLQQPCS